MLFLEVLKKNMAGTAAKRIRGEQRGPHARTIIQLDLDCFYAQVEMLRDPSLQGRPVGVRQKSLLVTTNYVARARGGARV